MPKTPDQSLTPITPRPEQQESINMSLTERQKNFLITELNMYLRAKNMQPEHAEEVNDIFRKLTGGDHENIEKYRRK